MVVSPIVVLSAINFEENVYYLLISIVFQLIFKQVILFWQPYNIVLYDTELHCKMAVLSNHGTHRREWTHVQQTLINKQSQLLGAY